MPRRRKRREKRYTLDIDGLPVEVVRKDIKNLYLRLQPPTGVVRASVPWRVGDEAIRTMVTERSAWIRRHQERFAKRSPRKVTQWQTGEVHGFEGVGYRLKVVEEPGRKRSVVSLGDEEITLQVGPGSTPALREALVDRWCRRELSERIPPLIKFWEPRLEVSVAEWRIRKMSTRWGTCNTQARRIWLGLSLMTRAPECLEYVVVHEMVHLLERSHNARFWGLMDRFLPEWRLAKEALYHPLVSASQLGGSAADGSADDPTYESSVPQMSTCGEEPNESEEPGRQPQAQGGQRSLW